jgi:hypothetical protein
LAGNISYIKNGVAQPAYCKECQIELKYTDKTTNSGPSGKFTINNIGIIDDQLEVTINSKDQKFIIPLIV